jgi:hypothetical protein
MIFQEKNINRQILLKYLVEGTCQVSFTKVKDNTNRVLLCTLNPNNLPAKFVKAAETVLKPSENEDILPVWDVVDNKWKSFRISKVNSFRTPDELTKQDKSGQDIESKQSQGIKARKEKAKKTFEDRIQKQKEQAERSRKNLEEARNIINKIRSGDRNNGKE